MKHFLGIILETVQVTSQAHSLNGYVNATQNRSDGAALTNIEGRQLPVVIPIVGIIISTLVFVAASIIWIAEDDRVRANDVEYLIAL